MTGPPVPAWLDGDRIDGSAPALPATDLGVRTGLGVFETLRAEAGRVAGLDVHLARLAAGGARLGIAVDVAHVRAGLAAVAVDAPASAVLRVTVTAGDADDWPPRPTGRSRTLVTGRIAPALPTPPADAVVVAGPRAPAGLGDVKTTSYAGSMRALAQARDRGAEVAVFEEDDRLLCAADGNLMVLHDDVLTTPPLDGRVLPGVTRGLVLGLAPGLGLAVREAPLARQDLVDADAVLVTSAVRRIRPLRRLDGRRLGPGPDPAEVPHPTVTRLLEALAAATAAATPLTA